MNTRPISETYLQHFGILGMKWGVRRYQNADGTRTPAGKRREKAPPSKDYRDTRKLIAKGRNALSNDELRQVNQRRQMETQYGQLNPNKRARAMKFVKGAAALGTGLAAAYALKDTALGKSVQNGVKYLIKKGGAKKAANAAKWVL